MTNTDKRDFIGRLQGLAEVFGRELSPALQVLYFEALRDLDASEVFAALSELAKSSKFFPKPVEIREAASGTGGIEGRTELGWMAWRAAAKRIGGGASLVVNDPVLAETLNSVFGGWPEACAIELSPEMWSSKRKEFDRVYRVMSSRGLQGARYLFGTHERMNASRADLDWMKFTPVGVLEGDKVRQISGTEAEQYRQQLSATANGLRRLTDGTDSALSHLLPADRDSVA